MRAPCSISSSLCAALGLLGACTSSPTGPSNATHPTFPPPASLVLLLAPSQAGIENGQSLRLTASRQDAHTLKIAPAEVAWVSSNPKIARVGSDGTVVGAGLGTAQITARWHGMSGSSTITVVDNQPASEPCTRPALAEGKAIARVPPKCGVL
jgi:hypothetical protein